MYQFIHFAMVFIGTITGFTIANYYVTNPMVIEIFPENTLLWISLLFGSSGYLIGVFVALFLNHFIKKIIKNINPEKIIPQIGGVVAGLIIANLVLIPLYVFMLNLNSHVMVTYMKLLIPVFFNIVLAVTGAKFAEKYRTGINSGNGILIDSNILIDGRIEKMLELDFFAKKIFVADFILEELQILSDSSDEPKRKKGRRGLELLESLKKKHQVIILEEKSKHDTVDNRLLKLAEKENLSILTNDYGLIKKGKVLGINMIFLKELEDTFRPVVNFGDRLTVKLIKKGKDENQAVGYFEDGTMIVAQEGRNFIGQTVNAEVENIVSTNAGKIIFVNVIESSE
ncbi:MAG: hypothetical protein WC337_04700 [Candidatus Muiribacteriota bacterium]